MCRKSRPCGEGLDCVNGECTQRCLAPTDCHHQNETCIKIRDVSGPYSYCSIRKESGYSWTLPVLIIAVIVSLTISFAYRRKSYQSPELK